MKKAPPGYQNPHNETNLLEIPRLSRLIGQLEGIRKMIEEGRHCYEVIHQLRAVSSAVRGMEAKILEHHIGHLIDEVIENPKSRLYDVKKKDLMNVLKGKLLISS
jgi:DNA-binding FrmR family transcriptional regulator